MNEPHIITARLGMDVLHVWDGRKWIYAGWLPDKEYKDNPRKAIDRAYKYPSLDHAERAVQRMHQNNIRISSASPMPYEEAVRKVNLRQPLR